MNYRIALFVLLVLPLVFGKNATTPLDTCGGNCPSNDCKSCPCGTSTAPISAATACAAYSGWNQAHCQCIVNHESGGNSHAVNQNSNGSLDVGLWQINSVNWGSCNGGAAPCAEVNNRNCAIAIYKSSNSFRAWSTCSACGAC